MYKCAAGYDLPQNGPCKKCGATENADICYEYPRQLERRIAELEQELSDCKQSQQMAREAWKSYWLERAAEIVRQYCPAGEIAIRAEIESKQGDLK